MLNAFNPMTGDAGISPIVLVLAVICAIIVVGCIVWTIVLNAKNSKISTTVVTVTEDEEPDTTIVEDIEEDNTSTDV